MNIECGLECSYHTAEKENCSGNGSIEQTEARIYVWMFYFPLLLHEYVQYTFLNEDIE